MYYTLIKHGFFTNQSACRVLSTVNVRVRAAKQGFKTPTQKLLPSFTFKSKESEISFVVPPFSLEFMTSSTYKSLLI